MRFTSGIVLGTTEVHHLTQALQLAEKLAVMMEADKNKEFEPSATEVRLLKAIEQLRDEDGISVESMRQLASLPPLIDED